MKSDNNLYIFLHIPKCAGSTLSYHIEKNINKNERLKFELSDIGLDGSSAKRYKYENKDYLDAVDKYLSNINKKKRQNIKVIYGHIAPFGIHKYFNKKPYYFTFLRDPTKRTVSLYNYWRTRYEDEPDKNKNKLYFKRNLLVNGKVLNFDNWVERKYNNKSFKNGSTTMATYLRKMGYLKDSVESMFDNFRFVGLNQRFGIDSLYIYAKLGLSKYFLSRNISRNYVKDYEIRKCIKMIRDKNRIDYVIYKYGKKKNQNMISSKKYVQIAKKMKVKKTLMLPFTQLLYDFMGTRHALPSLIRKQLRLTK